MSQRQSNGRAQSSEAEHHERLEQNGEDALVKVVVDTNVIVSGLGFGGRPFDVLLRTFDQDNQLLASE